MKREFLNNSGVKEKNDFNSGHYFLKTLLKSIVKRNIHILL